MGILSDVNFFLKGSRCAGDRNIFPLSNPKQKKLVLPEPVSKFGAMVSSSCNGLLCLDDFDGNCLLWNPSTGEHKLLPPTSLEVKRPPDEHVSSFFCSGFGFDSRSQDYKVVRFMEKTFNIVHEEDRFQVELYSLNSDSWKRISYPRHQAHPFNDPTRPVNDPPHPFNDPATCVDGVHYWIYVSFQVGFVLSFDFADEKFSSFRLPESFVRGVHTAHLLEFDGSLAAVIYPYKGSVKPFDIWVWNGGLWTNILTIEPLPGVHRLLGFLKNGEEILILGSNHQLLLYDRVTRELKDVSIPGYYHERLQLMHYVETSVQLSGKSSKKRAP
ncbi:hypothetical protein PTKIN_Ptkin02bG0228400 [Pterospermum kingtungense]